MIKIKHKRGIDNKEEYWRMSIKYEPNDKCMVVETENFTNGFHSNETLNSIVKYSDIDKYGVYDNYVTYLTKDPAKMDSVLNNMINALHKILIGNIKFAEKEIEKQQKSLTLLKNGLNCPLFRHKKIEKILK